MILRTPKEVGAAIKQRRIDKGLAQGELADLVGVSRWWVNEIERGKAGAELGLILGTLNALELQLTVAPRSTLPSPIDRILDRARSGST